MKHRYVMTSWSNVHRWSYAICECELAEGEHRNHRTVEQKTGYVNERAARMAGTERLSQMERVTA